MSFSESEKEQLVSSLMDLRRESQRAELNLRFQKKEDAADKIKDANKALTRQIDRQLARLMEEWLGAAAQASADLQAANSGLEAAIGDIKNKIKIGQNVVKAVGFLDDAVAIAKKALAGGI